MMGARASESRGARAVALFMGVALMGLASLSIWDSVRPLPPEANFHTDYWFPAAVALERQREVDVALRAEVTLGVDERQVIEAFERFNLEEVRAKGGFAEEGLRAAQTMMEQAAQRYYQRHGARSYRALGAVLRERFVQALVELFASDTIDQTSLAEASQTVSEEDGYLKKYQALGGRFLNQAFRAGLVSPAGVFSPRSRWVAGWLFSRRWATWILEHAPVETMMTRLEWLGLKKWKVEAHRSLSLQRRLELATEVSRLDSSYPRSRVCAAVFARAGRWEQAEKAYLEALVEYPADRQLTANLAAVRAQISVR